MHNPDPMPTNLPAERTVLGAFIEDADLFSEAISEGLTADDFSISAHRRIFGAILELRAKNCPIDYIAVAEQIGNAPDDFALIGDLISGVVIERGHILHHARIVKKKSRLRALMKVAEWISLSATEATADPDALVHATLTKLEAMDANRVEVSA